LQKRSTLQRSSNVAVTVQNCSIVAASFLCYIATNILT